MGDKMVYKYFKEVEEYDKTVFKPVNMINKCYAKAIEAMY